MTTHHPIPNATSPLSQRERARVRAKRQIELTMFAAGIGTVRWIRLFRVAKGSV